MDEKSPLIFDSKPTLRNPGLVCCLDGWVNAGNVSTAGIDFLIRQFKAVKFAEMPASRYNIYRISGGQGNGPIFKMDEGLIGETSFPQNQFFYARVPASDNDLILFRGTEPNLNWEEYADAIVDLGRQFGASRLVAFGGLLEEIPYTREPKMTCTCTSPKVKREMEQYNMQYSNREGPATFNQMILYSCMKKNLDGIGLTVRVPYYPQFNVGVEYSPRSIKAVLVRLNHILHLNLDFTEIDSDIKELQGKLDFVRQQNPGFNTNIEELEKEYAEMTYKEPLDMSPSEGVKFAEEFLKKNQDHSTD